MFNDVITLVKRTGIVNSTGDTVINETKRDVFVKLKSIGQSEFYQAKAVGVVPEYKFVMADFLDYEGETIVLYSPYNGQEEECRVIRTYRADNRLELVCKRGID